MTPLRVLLPAATLALGLLAGALPSHAAVFADFTPDTGASDFKWVRTTSPGTVVVFTRTAPATPATPV